VDCTPIAATGANRSIHARSARSPAPSAANVALASNRPQSSSTATSRVWGVRVDADHDLA